MRSVGEFIQRLQNDPEFEQRAQAYENSDEFMEFVKAEGYDFTLDQLLDEFKHEQPAIDQVPQESPASSKTVEDFIQRLQDDPEFEKQARAFEDNDAFLEFVKNEGYDFTLDQLMAGFKQVQGLLKKEQDSPPPKAEEQLIRHVSESSDVSKAAEPSSGRSAGAQKRPGALHPKFEGSSGGRRRGMKWRQADSEGVE